MSVWRWGKPSRSVEKRDGLMRWPDHLLGSGSYADINLGSMESTLQSIALRSGMDLIASLASELPMHVYVGSGKQRRPVDMPGYLEDPDGEGYGLEDWCYRALMSWLTRGNLYGDVLDRGPSGFLRQVNLHYPDEVSGSLDPDGVVRWTVCGKPVTDTAAFLHRRVNPMAGRVLGLSPVAFHASQIGVSLTSTQFGLQWFRDGAHPGAILQNTEADLTEHQAKTAKERFLASLRGRREPAVLGKGWEYKQVQLSPEDSQFLETQGYSEAQCCRILGPGIAEVLGYESGGSLTYTNVESRSAHLLVYTENKWLRRLERLLSQFLPRPQYVLIDRDALLQSTTLERYRAHASALKNRWKTVNEVRDDEDMQDVEWGDEPNPSGSSPAGDDDSGTGAEAPKPGGGE